MATFVLVHGAWHGGWCWSRVTDRLRARGHQAFAPSLSGLAENGHRLSADIGHDVHIEDVTRVIEWNDLAGVVLVGHSYGGLVVTGVAAGRVRARLAHLVVLDGSTPRPGESMMDLAVPAMRDMFALRTEDGLMALPDIAAMGVTEPADVAWVQPKLTPHPAKTFQEPLHYDERRLAGLARTFIRCTGANGERVLSPSAARCRASPDWAFRELETGHDAMVTMPAELTELLEEAAGR